MQVTAPAAADVPEPEAADPKPLSKKEKKRRAKEAAANGQIERGFNLMVSPSNFL